MHIRFPWSAAAVLLLTAISAFPASADFLVSGTENNTIYRFSETTGEFLGNLLGPSDGLNGPVGMRVGPDGNLYIANQGSGVIQKYDFGTGQLSTFANTGFAPSDIQFTASGDLLTSDFAGSNVFRFDLATGNNLGAFTSNGSLISPTNMLFHGDYLYVSSLFSSEVQRFDALTGEYHDTFVTAASGGLDFPAGLTYGPDGNLYVSSVNNNKVIRYDGITGAPLDPVPFLEIPFFFPTDNVWVGDDLYLLSAGGFGVYKYDGENVTPFAFLTDGDGNFIPMGISGQILVATVPEASSVVLCGVAGMLGCGAWLRRRRKSAN
ncbi:MAG: NHL repeat-containing protein [Planctomycetota bacterium]